MDQKIIRLHANDNVVTAKLEIDINTDIRNKLSIKTITSR